MMLAGCPQGHCQGTQLFETLPVSLQAKGMNIWVTCVCRTTKDHCGTLSLNDSRLASMSQ